MELFELSNISFRIFLFPINLIIHIVHYIHKTDVLLYSCGIYLVLNFRVDSISLFTKQEVIT